MLDSVLEKLEATYNFKRTLRDSSADTDSNQYMTDCEQYAFDFDEIMKRYVRQFPLSKAPRSNDALIRVGDELYFIEFKNGVINTQENFEISVYTYSEAVFHSEFVVKRLGC